MQFVQRTISTMAIALLTVLPALAQSAMTPRGSRGGFYISGGPAYGWNAQSTCGACGARGLGAPSGYLAFGGGLSANVRIGFEADGWWYTAPATASAPSLTYSRAFYTLAIAYYPSRAIDLFLKVNVGMSHSGPSDAGISTGFLGAFAFGLGAGYDVKLGTGPLRLIPFVNYMLVATDGQFLQTGIGFGYRH